MPHTKPTAAPAQPQMSLSVQSDAWGVIWEKKLKKKTSIFPYGIFFTQHEAERAIHHVQHEVIEDKKHQPKLFYDWAKKYGYTLRIVRTKTFFFINGNQSLGDTGIMEKIINSQNV